MQKNGERNGGLPFSQTTTPNMKLELQNVRNNIPSDGTWDISQRKIGQISINKMQKRLRHRPAVVTSAKCLVFLLLLFSGVIQGN